MYNKNNVFYKILKSELPAKRIYEDEVALSFYDINPAYKVHALVITKGLYTDFADFMFRASRDEIKIFFDAVAKVADLLDVAQTGYRIVSNIGKDSQQEVPHFHMHILGGELLPRK
jgi:diadenosine tetraphosphate (Ap4A) HIT family hydrolase